MDMISVERPQSDDYDAQEEFKRTYFAEGGDWRGLAECKSVDPEMMHPARASGAIR